EKRLFLEGTSDLAGYYFVREAKVDKKDCPFREVLIISNRWEELAQADKGAGSKKLQTYSMKKVLAAYDKKDDEFDPLTLNPSRREPLNYDHYHSVPKGKDYTAEIYYVYNRGVIAQRQDSVQMEFVVIFHVDKPDKNASDAELGT